MPVVMPFGRHRGQPLGKVPDDYLAWLANQARNVDPVIREAAQRELFARGTTRDSCDHWTDRDRPARSARSVDLAGVDRAAIFALLSDLLATGCRVVARGEGAVHIYGRPAPDLRVRLARHHAAIDALARHVRIDATGRPRVTPATVILARLRADGLTVQAMPGGAVAVEPTPTVDPLAELTAGGRHELWCRLALGLPEPGCAGPTAGPAHPGTLAGLHRHCLTFAERAGAAGVRHRQQRWERFAAAVAAVRSGQGGWMGVRAELAEHCGEQAERLERQERTQAAARWKAWSTAVAT